MIALIHLSERALAHPPSLATLAEFAEHELVLVCARCGPAVPSMPALRRALSGRRVAALAVGGELVAQERRLIAQVLAEGQVVLILTADEPTTATMVHWSWLAADRIVTLPD